MYLHICTNERHKCCTLSMQQSEMLLYALNLGFFILGFAIYPVAYGVGFTLQGLPMLLLLFASSSDFFPLINPVVPGLGRRTPRSCLLASSTV